MLANQRKTLGQNDVFERATSAEGVRADTLTHAVFLKHNRGNRSTAEQVCGNAGYLRANDDAETACLIERRGSLHILQSHRQKVNSTQSRAIIKRITFKVFQRLRQRDLSQCTATAKGICLNGGNPFREGDLRQGCTTVEGICADRQKTFRERHLGQSRTATESRCADRYQSGATSLLRPNNILQLSARLKCAVLYT